MQAMQGTLLIIGVVFATCVSAKLHCEHSVVDIPEDWVSMESECVKKMRDQVQKELNAAITYMAMGAHFSRDTYNRPGFAKIFFESASEEREHAIKIIEYLLMRGGLTSDIGKLIKDTNPERVSWTNGVDALTHALEMEHRVTGSIREIIKVCEDASFNDYHLVDYLSGDFLDEQYKGQRDLAGKISTLGKMMKTNEALGEFLFDKKLLNGESL